MSQDIIIDNIIMTILFSLVLKKKNLFVNTNTIHSVESFLLWNSYTTFFFTIFFTSSTTTKREKHSDMKPTCYLELTWSI